MLPEPPLHSDGQRTPALPRETPILGIYSQEVIGPPLVAQADAATEQGNAGVPAALNRPVVDGHGAQPHSGNQRRALVQMQQGIVAEIGIDQVIDFVNTPGAAYGQVEAEMDRRPA